MWCKQESCTARAESGLGQPADQPGPESSEASLPSRKAGAAVEEAARKRSWLDSSGEQGRQVGGTQKQALFRHSAEHSDSTLRDSCQAACFPQDASEGRRAQGAGAGSWQMVRIGSGIQFLTAKLMLSPLQPGVSFLLFCKAPESKYLQFCRPDGLCYNYSPLISYCKTAIEHRLYVNEWTWLCSNKALYINTLYIKIVNYI